MEQSTPRPIFTVYINGKDYQVYSIEGKEHEGLNDVPTTWWLHFKREASEGAPTADSKDLLPFDKGINRVVWDISFQQRNTVKYKWGGESFRSSTWCVMKANGRTIYEFGAGGSDHGFSYAMAKAQALTVELLEFPGYNFLHPQENEGRKIYWYGLPATVRVSSRGWEIGIVPDYTCGLDKTAWWQELNHRKSKVPASQSDKEWEGAFDSDDECKEEDYINWGDAFSDAHIDWFRS